MKSVKEKASLVHLCSIIFQVTILSVSYLAKELVQKPENCIQ